MKDNDSSVPRADAESGSAYVLVLLVLLVLTLLGLVLTFITQSEVEVGANERSINRVFYGAEGGISAVVANVLLANDHSAQDLTFMDPGSTTQGTEVVIPAPQDVNTGPCNLCEINQGSDFQAITHGIQATATRFSLDGGGTKTVLDTKNLELMVECQPCKEALDVSLDQSTYK